MTNRTLERARKRAQKIMEDLQGEGMFTLRELKVLLEREIGNRLGVSDPTESGTSTPQERTGPVFANVERFVEQMAVAFLAGMLFQLPECVFYGLVDLSFLSGWGAARVPAAG